VIVLLVWILLMENSRRGMFGGKKLPVKQEIIRFARKYTATSSHGRRSTPSGITPW